MRITGKNHKKVFWLLIFLLATSLFLWGCGGGAPEETADPEPAEIPEDDSGETTEEPAAEEREMDEAELAALFGGGQALNEMFYEMKLTGPEIGTTETSIWLKNDRMRSESFMMGQHFIMIYDTEAVYTLDPGEKTAIKMPMDMGFDDSMDPITADDLTSDVDAESLTYLGMEEYNGLICHVVQSTDRDTGHGVKMWLHPEYGFPMKVQSLSPNPEEEYLMEVTNFQVGNVSDDKFVVPSDYEVIDFSEMFQNMPNMPNMPAVPGT